MDTLAETLWREFAVETDEHLQSAEGLLGQAGSQPTASADIAHLFRSFHSVKGLARAMDVLGIESVAHHAENLLGLVRDGRAALTADVADLLLQAVDALKQMRDAVVARRRDEPADPELIARLAAAFARSGGAAETAAPPAPIPSAAGPPLHEDPEMLAIFVEMVESRAPQLCAALGDEAAERAAAVDAAETLQHAAEVMKFDALAASVAGLRQVIESPPPVDGAAHGELLARLADIRLRLELLGDLVGRDDAAVALSAALRERSGAEYRRIAAELLAADQRLQQHLRDNELRAAQTEAAAMARQARALRALAAALALGRIADAMLLLEDICGRIASGEIEPSEMLTLAADTLLRRVCGMSDAGAPEDLSEEEAAELVPQLRAPVEPIAQNALRTGADPLVAGLHVPDELVAVLSDENLAELERGIRLEGLIPYEVLVHPEADASIGERVVEWLTRETRAITNRTVLHDEESWFEVLALSALQPHALADALQALDPGRICVLRLRRLTDSPEGELVLDRAGAAEHEAAASIRPTAFGNLIRIRGEAVDTLLDEIGELRSQAAGLSHLIRGVGSRAMLARARAFAARVPSELRAEFNAAFADFRDRDRRLLDAEERMSRGLGRLHQRALELRVVPVDAVFGRLPRIARELARHRGKSVEFIIEGREVRVDKSIVDALSDPLIHMVRNAVDHGIEPAEDRRRAGKPERARLVVRAVQHGAEVHIEVTDDGRGLDAPAIRAKAVARGLISRDQADAIGDEAAFRFIFEPGLSTAERVSETSGRGVGMDIVLATVQRLNGDIRIRSEPGRGTSFTLLLPLSAALQNALIVRVAEQSLAIPERHVAAVAEIETGAIRLVGSHRAVLHREAVLPLYGLGELLGMAQPVPGSARPFEPIVVATNGRQMIGLEVDAIEQRQELFLKDLDPRLAAFPGVGGASVLGDGRVVLVLDGEALIQLASRGVVPAGTDPLSPAP